MINVAVIVAELAKIARERQIVKQSLLDDPMKEALCAELDRRVKALNADLAPIKGASKGV